MSADKPRVFLRAVGLAVLIWGLIIVIYYVPQATAYSSESHLLYNLSFMCLGIAFELLGLGLLILGRK